MITFEIQDMTCGHCVATITRAVQAIDKEARVEADLARHRVGIESRASDPQAIKAAIEEAGYTPVPLPA